MARVDSCALRPARDPTDTGRAALTPREMNLVYLRLTWSAHPTPRDSKRRVRLAASRIAQARGARGDRRQGLDLEPR